MNLFKYILRSLVHKRVAKRLKRNNSNLAKYFSKKK